MSTAQAFGQLLIFPNTQTSNRNYFKTRLTGMKTRKEAKEEQRQLFVELTDYLMSRGWTLKELADIISQKASRMTYRRIRSIRSPKLPYLTPKPDEIKAIYELFKDDLVGFVPESERETQDEVDVSLKQVEELQAQIAQAKELLQIEINKRLEAENRRIKKELEELRKGKK